MIMWGKISMIKEYIIKMSMVKKPELILWPSILNMITYTTISGGQYFWSKAFIDSKSINIPIIWSAGPSLFYTQNVTEISGMEYTMIKHYYTDHILQDHYETGTSQ